VPHGGRITFIVDTTTYGGAEVYVAHLLRGLPDRFARTLVATRGLPEELRGAANEVDAPIVLSEPVRNKFDLVRFARQSEEIRSTRPALVHLNLPIVASSRHALAPIALMRLPAVATLHLVAPIRSELQRKTLGYFFRRLPRVIAVSAETKEQLCRDLGVEESAVRVVRNGVAVRKPLVLHDRTPVRIGAVGRLTEQKGFDLLIEAVRRLVERGLPVEAVVVGHGPDRAQLEDLAAGLPVSFVGSVPDVGHMLSTFDIFCLPSRWEGLPFALLEAMMAGLPCVAASVGDVPDALGPVGVLVPPENLGLLVAALSEAALSLERRRALGAAAHRRAVERYSLERMVAETVRIYDEVLAP
jgi:glycosyltransferase involved in cell wall biosynthesis